MKKTKEALKRNEPVELKRPRLDFTLVVNFTTCPNCKSALTSTKYNYCPFCGKLLKWVD